MRLLLDTHILLWWLSNDRRLTAKVRAMIISTDHVAVSSATIWEIAIKKSLGRIRISLDDLVTRVKADGFYELPVQFAHALLVDSLPHHHRDPFDRLLIAQAIAEGSQLVTADEAVLGYVGVTGFHAFAV